MIRVNLLPHREIKRKQQQKDFYIMLGSVVGLGVAIWFLVHSYLNGQIEEQQGRNAYLESEIAILDKQIEEIKKLKEQTQALLQRKKIVESLQANRSETVYLLDQLVRQLPDGVYLRNIAQKGPSVTITGYAQSNARVSTYMRNLESSAYLEKPSLNEIKAVTERNLRLSEFSLAVSMTRNKEEIDVSSRPGAKPAAKPVATAPVPVPTSQVVSPAPQGASTGAPSAGATTTPAAPAGAATAAAQPQRMAGTPPPAAATSGSGAQK